VRLGFRLQLPHIALARQVLFSSGDQNVSDHDVQLRQLKPGEGMLGLELDYTML
jgi:hypothetical protein